MKKKIQDYLCVVCVLLIFLSSCSTNKNIPFAENTEINKHMERANKNYEIGFYKKAEGELRWIIKQYPNDADSHFKLGVIYGKQGLTKKSCHEFLKTISINPDYAKANYNLGVLFMNDDSVCRYETVAYFFEKYLTLDPSSEHRESIERWLLKNEKKVHSEEKPKPKKSRNP